MTIWAIIPVKPFRRAKSRLSPVLSPGEREGLNREFLEHTLDVLAQAPHIERTLVISRDAGALSLARERGAHTVTESGAPKLNEALTRATQTAAALGARAVLVIPTDLPLLSAADIRRLLAPNDAERLVVIAPDRRDEGTNALFVRPPLLFGYAFGPGSFREHCARAMASGARLHLRRLPGTGLDVDGPDDLQAYRERRIRSFR